MTGEPRVRAESGREFDREFDIATYWRKLVRLWAEKAGVPVEGDEQALSLDLDLTGSGRTLTLRFTTTRRLLVAFMTDGRRLRGDQLAVAAAAANAWNTEQLFPMLSVWDVRGPEPCIAGVCQLPLGCRMTPADFAAMADDWADQARQMFTRCHQVFRL
ncbi:hypothetical protein [Streptomyces indicus]|uniref:Sensory transduction regulator n=1 Tax=Streptomyces indicus TaxID=417292 RepID=A0A1G9BJK8_9ACTN|nr:hypothetical protein [Streptomyces indicus]SDK39709.1 hypothetical protein SAMN05421806_10795 [Streptomyces indicus]